jgi:hypothetical protein
MRCLEGTSVGLRERPDERELDPTPVRRERIPADRPRVCDSDARRACAVGATVPTAEEGSGQVGCNCG